MGKGLKRFFAMVSVVGLASSVGAVGCAANGTASYETFYKLVEGKTADSDLFTKTEIDGRDFYKIKSDLKDDMLKKANEALTANFTAYHFGTDLNRKGLSNIAVAGIALATTAAAAGAAVAIEELVVHAEKNCE